MPRPGGRGRRPGEEEAPGWPAPADDLAVERLAAWTAPLGLAGLAWLENAYHAPVSPRVLGWAVAGYLLVHLVAVARFGRRWLARGESFTVYFAAVAAIAPLTRDPHGRLVVRPPLAGLARLRPDGRLVAVLVVVIGATVFDGIASTGWWVDLLGDRRGWSFTFVSTLGMAWAVALVALVYLVAAQLSGRALRGGPGGASIARPGPPGLGFGSALVPLALGYSVAHWATSLLFDSRNLVVQLSDPFGRGWDLIGTGDWRFSYTSPTFTQVVWVQILALVVSHLAAVAVAHDGALTLDRSEAALRSQYPLLAAFVISAASSTYLLIGV